MFGIGLGEFFIILLIAFLISPKSLPKVARKVGELIITVDRIKAELFSMKNDVREINNETGITQPQVHPDEAISEPEGEYPDEMFGGN